MYPSKKDFTSVVKMNRKKEANRITNRIKRRAKKK